MKKLIVLILLVLGVLVIAVGALTGGYLLGKSRQITVNPIARRVDETRLNSLSPQVDAEILQGANALYNKNCASCHGVNGDGSGFAPPLNSPEMRSNYDAPIIFAVIDEGRPGTAMPAWGGRLTREQIDSLVALIRNWDQLDEAGSTQ